MNTRLLNNAAQLVFLSAMGLALGACDSGKNQGASCPTGDVKCACFPNQSCNDGLVCLSDICVSSSGAGGSSSVNTSTDPSMGGSTANNVGGDTSASVGGDTSNATTSAGGSSSTTTEAGGTSAATGGADSQTGGSNATAGGTTAAATTTATGGEGTATGGVGATTGGASAATGGDGATTGGVSGTTGGSTSTSTSPYISQTDGWATDPAHGISGPLYTFADEGGSIIYPDCATGATCFDGKGPTPEFCVSGIVAQAVDQYGDNCELNNGNDCVWATYWGAAVAINPNQSTADGSEPVEWDASAFSGISFAISIDAMPPNLRIYINLMDGTQYCAAIATSKTYTLTWDMFRTECYRTGGTELSGAALTQIKNIAWQAGTNASLAKDYDFCVSNVKIN